MRIVPIVALIAGVLASTAAVSATEGAQRQNPYATLFTGQLNGAPTPQTPPAPAPQFIPLPPLPRSYPFTDSDRRLRPDSGAGRLKDRFEVAASPARERTEAEHQNRAGPRVPEISSKLKAL